MKDFCIAGIVVLLCFAVTEGSECCKSYTDILGTFHESQFCADYCCYDSIILRTDVTCCSDISYRVPEYMRDQECINWVKEHVWVPIVCGVLGLIIIIAVFTCCCCCGCCACCRNSKPGTIVVHQPTPMQATSVSVSNTHIQNTNPLHVGY